MTFEAGKLVMQKPQAGTRATQIETHARIEFKDITGLIQKLIAESGVESGVCYVFAPHTTAAILVQENDDPALQKDLAMPEAFVLLSAILFVVINTVIDVLYGVIDPRVRIKPSAA